MINMSKNNVLVLSCGSRNKIIQYFKEELGDAGDVYAADNSSMAPALYVADSYFIVPRITEDHYIEYVFDMCKKYKIKIVVSLIDPELSVLAEHKQKFLEAGILPIISDYEIINLCLDKFRMYKYLSKRSIPTIKSYIDKELFYADVESGLISYPVFIKPKNGSASIDISICANKDEVEWYMNRNDNLMIQEYMSGEEYGVDAYVDMISGELVTMFAKRKLRMRAGETDKSISVVDEDLYCVVKKLVIETGVRGVIDIDLFMIDGTYYVSEINPRFGGGYPHAHACGMNIPKMVLINAQGDINELEKTKYESDVVMMKYNEVIIKRRNK